MTKWCINCKSWRASWVDAGHFGQDYEKRCWSCDNYTLNIAEMEQARIQVPLKKGCMRPGMQPPRKR